MKAKVQSEIQSASVARGVDKQTHEVYYVVKSDSSDTTWYTVRWSNERLMWCCNCPARCDGCKHQRATLEVLRIRRATIALAMGARMQAEQDSREKFCDRCHRPATEYRVQSGERLCERCIAELERNAGATRTREVLTLNGNRPFSLMR